MNDLVLISLTKYWDELKVQVKSIGYLTIKVVKGTELFEEYSKTNYEINKLKTKLIRVKLDQVIDEFYEIIYIEEVNQQL